MPSRESKAIGNSTLSVIENATARTAPAFVSRFAGELLLRSRPYPLLSNNRFIAGAEWAHVAACQRVSANSPQ
jgi:hypothetical protein